MRIGIHLLDLTPGMIGGMEQYVRNLISYSTKRAGRYEIFLFLRKHNIDSFSGYGGNVFRILLGEQEDRNEQLHRWIRDLKLNVWFCPLLVLEPIDVSIPSAVTIPDVQHEAYPEFFDPPILRWRLEHYGASAERCSAVLTLSNYSKQTIVRTYNVPDEKVHAIHLDASEEFYFTPDEAMNRKVARKYRLPDRYGLYPASTWPHKNHLNLLRAVEILKKRYGVAQPLVLTGSQQQEHSAIAAYIQKRGLSGQIRMPGYVPMQEMPYIYRNAGFLAFPSLYEGFGMPLVEAMRTQTPIVCSNAASIPEIVGDCALLFDPNDPEDIAVKMLEVMNEENKRELVRKGTRHAGHFSWDKCVKQTLAVFDEIRGASPLLP